MTTLAAMLADVYSVTNRPDLVAETQLAVRAATLKAHQSDFFPKDILQSGVTWTTPDYVQSLVFMSLWPRFKALKYLRKYDNVGLAPGDFFTVITPTEVLDNYGVAKSDICYIAGQSIEIKSSTQDAFMLIGMYLYPDVTPTGYASWIADNHPFAIIYEAARVIFKMVGYDAQAAAFEKLVAEEYRLLQVNNLALIGE